MAVTAFAGGQASPAKIDGITSSKPVPSFVRPPRIDPAGGVVGVVLSVKDGDVLNGSIAKRQWMLNETPIAGAVNATFATTTPGSYSVQSTVTGDGGTAAELSPAVLVTAPPSSGSATNRIRNSTNTGYVLSLSGGYSTFGAPTYA